ncbi:hypothetical protein [Ideonella sp.]|jgi:hypothetical protein|uniref:hypothetical protein n=1 Tax=Ideonella sp. TaxID=1929293 RepID=UPI0037C167F9
MVYLTRRASLLALCGGLALPVMALEKPTGPVVLSVAGDIVHRNASDRADFDMAMLVALPQHTLITTSPWHKQPTRFTGPLMRDVLASVGATGGKVRATALNNYQIEIPTEDFDKYSVVLVRLVDGQPMRIRDKGPLLIMYPFDQSSALRTQVHYGRAIWQLRRLDIL